jgi:transcriptional regulator with XRE-family HTH domain
VSEVAGENATYAGIGVAPPFPVFLFWARLATIVAEFDQYGKRIMYLHTNTVTMTVLLDTALRSVQFLSTMERLKERVHAQLVNEHFGSSLASIRRARGLSQAELGKIVGLSRGSISNLESGIQNVQLYQLFNFALALNCPPFEFMPALRDVVVDVGDADTSERIFLQIAKRQLLEDPLSGDDDDDANA